MNKQRIKSNSRGIYFGIIINPKVDVVEKIDWKSLDKKSVIEKLTTLDFPSRNELTSKLNRLVVINLSGNETGIEDFTGQFELGGDSKIPHYQLAIQMKTICRKKQVLNAFEAFINGHINVDIQYHYEEMKKYCTKEQEFLSEDYSSQIHKKLWKIDYRSKRPNLKRVIENPYPWQIFVKEEILGKDPEDRIIDWLVDPKGGPGKSTFVQAYVSNEQNYAIDMYLDNLDRMELSFIHKIEKFRKNTDRDSRVILFDFTRASNMLKVHEATNLMEHCKTGKLETNFNGKHKCIVLPYIHVLVVSNGVPDTSVLSQDRWRIWRLGGEEFENIIWLADPTAIIKDFNNKLKLIPWQIKLSNIREDDFREMDQFCKLSIPSEWGGIRNKNGTPFIDSVQFTETLYSTVNEAPNFVRGVLVRREKNEKIKKQK